MLAFATCAVSNVLDLYTYVTEYAIDFSPSDAERSKWVVKLSKVRTSGTVCTVYTFDCL